MSIFMVSLVDQVPVKVWQDSDRKEEKGFNEPSMRRFQVARRKKKDQKGAANAEKAKRLPTAKPATSDGTDFALAKPATPPTASRPAMV